MSMDNQQAILTVAHLEKSFGTHSVLRDISFSVCPGDVVSVIGASGSGKSTMLRCINLLEEPDGGQILYHDEDITSPKMNVPAYREKVGMVFQSFNLFNNMTVLDNCIVGQVKVAKRSKEEAREKALAFLDKVGMSAYVNAKPRQLSGGQKQRVAIARAVANNPDIILADEPTGALDSETSRMVMDIFHRLHEEEQRTILMITHSKELSAEAERILTLVDGRIVNEEVRNAR